MASVYDVTALGSDYYGSDTAVSAEERAANTAFIVCACNNHEALVAALKACAFRLATVVAAYGALDDANARALDHATAAIAKAEGAQ